MKNLNIMFCPDSNVVDQLEYQQALKEALCSTGTQQDPPSFGIDGPGIPYDVHSWFDMRNGKWEFKGFVIEVSPSLALMHHAILPGNDMDTTRRLAFSFLEKTLVRNYKALSFLDFFDEHRATLVKGTMAFYAALPSPESARSTLQELASHLDAEFNVNSDRFKCEGTMKNLVWTLRLADGMRIKLFVANESEFYDDDGSWPGDNPRKVPDALITFSQRVIVVEVEFFSGCLLQKLMNPLVWDLPSLDVYGYFCRRVKEALGLDKNCLLQLSAKASFPEEIMTQVFNRETGTTRLSKLLS